MSFREIVRLVFINIMENRIKVILTSLGIIVGASTIVMVIAIGRGGQMDVADQFKNLSAGAIDITSKTNSFGGGEMDFGGGGGFTRPSGGEGAMPAGMPSGGGMAGGIGTLNPFDTAVLSETDLEDIILFVPDIADATITASASKEVEGGNLESAEKYNISGVREEYAGIANLEMQIGDFITEADNIDKTKVVVLGYKVAESMFDTLMDAYDSVVEVDGRSYVVIGVLKEMGAMSAGIDTDNTIFMPFSTAEKYVMGRSISPQITVVADDVGNVPAVMEDVKTLLDESYSGAQFTITDAGSKMEAASQSANTLSLLLIAVASIVFIVGGIGIMNVLFVSVRERTREIGILKALGCSKKDVLMEFLLEANVISLLGGVLGVAASVAIMPLMTYTGMRVEPSLFGWGIALVFAIVTGTIFGFYPALKAASLIPIQALNQE